MLEAKRGIRIRPIDFMVLAGILLYAAISMMNRAPHSPNQASEFARSVRIDPLYKTAVQGDGRARSFESHAKTLMGYVSGPRLINGQSNGFTYLDLMFRPQAYDDLELIYVKNKNVRSQILDLLAQRAEPGYIDVDTVMKRGLFSRQQLTNPDVRSLLDRLGKDLIRTAKSVDAIQSAFAVSNARTLVDNLRLIPSPDGDSSKPWFSPASLVGQSQAPRDDAHAALRSMATIPGLDPQLQGQMLGAWNALGTAWVSQDASAVNLQIEKLAGLARGVAPKAYPSTGRLEMESWYFRYKSMTWVWLFYLMSVIPLLMAVIYHWPGARAVGMVMFVLAFSLHTVSLGIRWYISGRWPNANMFEAVTTSAWLGGVLAIALEWIVRKGLFRNLFALGSAVVSMVALMAAYYLPAQLDSGINNKMAALNDIWLYIHTNMIIWSYAVIGLACIPALLLLRRRWCKAWDDQTMPKLRLLVLPVALVILNYTGYRFLMHVLDDPAHELSSRAFLATVGACWASMMIVALELSAAKTRRDAGLSVERSARGGAAALMTAGGSFLRRGRPSPGEVYDGATMVLVEVAFIMLWTGTVMGAIWADHSWGRPWGWDPKEVFALNTFIIFLILIHVRIKVKDKAFWTAVLAIVGFEVMMFNWIVVNFVITGLHSYA